MNKFDRFTNTTTNKKEEPNCTFADLSENNRFKIKYLQYSNRRYDFVCAVQSCARTNLHTQKEKQKNIYTHIVYEYSRIQIGMERLTKCDHFRKHLALFMKIQMILNTRIGIAFES